MIGVLKGAHGEIQSINPKNYTATVKLNNYENMITGELQILAPLTYKNKEVHIPKIKTPVFCVFTGDGIEDGFIIGSYFSDNNKSESEDGTYKIDFQNSSLTIKENGEINMVAVKTTIESELEVKKGVKILGKLEVAKEIKSAETITADKNMYAKGFVPK